MKDFATKGTGNSRLLKTSLPAGTTWDQALEMLRSGTFPVDLAGYNSAGIQTMGTLLNKLNLLPDDLATALGLDPATATVKDALQAIKTQAGNASTTANNAVPKAGGTMTGKLTLNGDPTSNLHAATKQYVDNSKTPAELRVTTNAGVTVTCAKGGKTLTAVANSSGSAVLYPDSFGTWIVSATLNGVTLSIPYEINSIAVYTLALTTNLEQAGWDVIDAVSKSGNAASVWNVGDTKTISVGGVQYVAQIIGFNHDNKTAGGKAGITFQLKNCLNETAKMNPSDTNSGGWGSSAMRTNMNTYLAQLDAGLQAVIKPVNKLTSAGAQSATINSTSDKLFLLSEIEIFGTVTYSKAGEGAQYAFYQAGNSKIKNVGTTASSWWERSPHGGNSTYFCRVTSDGNASGNLASYSYGVAFGFCI